MYNQLRLLCLTIRIESLSSFSTPQVGFVHLFSNIITVGLDACVLPALFHGHIIEIDPGQIQKAEGTHGVIEP